MYVIKFVQKKIISISINTSATSEAYTIKVTFGATV